MQEPLVQCMIHAFTFASGTLVIGTIIVRGIVKRTRNRLTACHLGRPLRIQTAGLSLPQLSLRQGSFM